MVLCFSSLVLEGGYIMISPPPSLPPPPQQKWSNLGSMRLFWRGMTALSFSWLPEPGICNLQNKFKIKYPAGQVCTVDLTNWFAIQLIFFSPFPLSLLSPSQWTHCSRLFIFSTVCWWSHWFISVPEKQVASTASDSPPAGRPTEVIYLGSGQWGGSGWLQ